MYAGSLENEMAGKPQASETKRFVARVTQAHYDLVRDLAQTQHPLYGKSAGNDLVFLAGLVLLRHPDLIKKYNFSSVEENPEEIFRILDAYYTETKGKKSNVH